LLGTIVGCNKNPAVNCILVQLPLPPQIDGGQVLETIAVEKDVDGFHLYNVGGLVTDNTISPPCTPYGVMKLIESEAINAFGVARTTNCPPPLIVGPGDPTDRFTYWPARAPVASVGAAANAGAAINVDMASAVPEECISIPLMRAWHS
jgi:hypothetical protein